MLPKLVEMLSWDHSHEVQYEAAWVLTNVSSGTPDQVRALLRTLGDAGRACPSRVGLQSRNSLLFSPPNKTASVVEAQASLPLCRLLSSPHPKVKDQVRATALEEPTTARRHFFYTSPAPRCQVPASLPFFFFFFFLFRLIPPSLFFALFPSLSTSSLPCPSKACWCLGNIAGDGAELRDMLLHAGALEVFLNMLRVETNLELLRNVSWTISNFFRWKESPVPPHYMQMVRVQAMRLRD